jgi:hypothetical protein
VRPGEERRADVLDFTSADDEPPSKDPERRVLDRLRR